MKTIVIGCLGAWIGMAAAAQSVIHVSTVPQALAHWHVWEKSGGKLVEGAPVNIGKTGYGNVPGLSFPFTDNDGFWYAERVFLLPATATNAVLHIARLGVDDRVVVELNGTRLVGAGTTSHGHGFMTFRDGGNSAPFYFRFKSGTVEQDYTAGFKPGANVLRLVVNNTGMGIFGNPVPESQGGPTNVGLVATVSYTVPGAAAPLDTGLH